MKIKNMTSAKGNTIANQFIAEMNGGVEMGGETLFQSYDTLIAVIKPLNGNPRQVLLDADNWDYSKTTGKYRNLFLGETKKETQAKIESGEYILTNLN